MDIIKSLNPSRNVLVASLIGTLIGFLFKALLEWFISSRSDNRGFRKDIRLERVNDLMNQFPILTKEIKIQIQELEYVYNDDYWKLQGFTENMLESRRKSLEERSERIVELKERCTNDMIVFKNSKCLRDDLDKMINILEKDLPKFFKDNTKLADTDHNYLQDLNEIRRDFNNKLQNKLKING